MAKRSASNELNHDNWDKEEPEEEAGVFRRADQNILENRVIRTAKRRISSSPMGEKKAFTAFSGFGVANTAGIPKPDFSFLSKTPNGVEGRQKEEEVGEGRSPKKGGEGEGVGESDYYGRLKELNQCLIEWITLHVKKNPCCILTPVFKDYEKHLESLGEGKIEKTSEGKLKDSDGGGEGSGFKFGQGISDKTPKAPSMLGGSMIFGKPTAPSASKQSSSGGFKITTFGNNAPPAKEFSFSGTKPALFANVALPPKAEEEADEESEELPKEEVKLVSEDDALFSQRVKVFVKKEGSYSDRGAGMLYVKRVPSMPSRHQVIVRADTSLGNLLINFLLGPSTPLQRVGKNNVLVVCVPTPDAKPPPVTVLIRVKTSEEADGLHKKLEDLKKE